MLLSTSLPASLTAFFAAAPPRSTQPPTIGMNGMMWQMPPATPLPQLLAIGLTPQHEPVSAGHQLRVRACLAIRGQDHLPVAVVPGDRVLAGLVLASPGSGQGLDRGLLRCVGEDLEADRLEDLARRRRGVGLALAGRDVRLLALAGNDIVFGDDVPVGAGQAGEFVIRRQYRAGRVMRVTLPDWAVVSRRAVRRRYRGENLSYVPPLHVGWRRGRDRAILNACPAPLRRLSRERATGGAAARRQDDHADQDERPSGHGGDDPPGLPPGRTPVVTAVHDRCIRSGTARSGRPCRSGCRRPSRSRGWRSAGRPCPGDAGSPSSPRRSRRPRRRRWSHPRRRCPSAGGPGWGG